MRSPFGEDRRSRSVLVQGKQIGKVVVSLDEGVPPVVHPAEPPVGFEAEATYLITGGLGGLGRVVATWMVDQGAPASGANGAWARLEVRAGDGRGVASGRQ